MNFKVKILRHPTEEDWMRAKMLALNTVWKKAKNAPDENWKIQLLESEHSPIRTLMFTIEMEIPYYVSVHYVRHKYGVEHYVTSQRNDRQDKYDRTKAPQDSMVCHIMEINAQELMFMARRRLCTQADIFTNIVMQEICKQVIECCPEFSSSLVPMCAYRGGRCTEFKCCGLNKKYQGGGNNDR